MSKIYVHLGRNGDILNTLPLLQHEAKRTGEPVNLLVASAYVELLDGVSYVNAVEFKGEFQELPRALVVAHSDYDEVVSLQVYGHGYRQQRTQASFVLEQWANSGAQDLWGLPLEFDQRDLIREAVLAEELLDGRPLVIVAAGGISSPFPHTDRMVKHLREVLGNGVQVLNVSEVRAYRFYDMLGLFDRAKCVITTDTAHMHLAHGSDVPVIALATSGPTDWHASARRKGHVLYTKYDQYPWAEASITRTVERLVRGDRNPPRFVHVVPMHRMDAETKRRHVHALGTWDDAFDEAWFPLLLGPGDVERSARDIGERKDFQFVHDLVNEALKVATEDDIIILSNSDACVLPSIADEARLAVDNFGAFFTHRWDFPERGMPVEVTKADVQHAKWYPGSDLFGFSPAWWKEHGPKYPDMLIGCEYVDAVLRQLIKFNGGTELHQCVYHEKHASHWQKNKASRGNLHNKELAAAWFKAHGTDDLDPFGEAQAQRIRRSRGFLL